MGRVLLSISKKDRVNGGGEFSRAVDIFQAASMTIEDNHRSE
jgi:hypothetical protein